MKAKIIAVIGVLAVSGFAFAEVGTPDHQTITPSNPTPTVSQPVSEPAPVAEPISTSVEDGLTPEPTPQEESPAPTKPVITPEPTPAPPAPVVEAKPVLSPPAPYTPSNSNNVPVKSCSNAKGQISCP